MRRPASRATFGVPHYVKAEVREIIRVAKRRRIALQGVPTDEQMDDPKIVEPFVKRYGTYPDDRDFSKLKAVHKALRLELSAELAMDNPKCQIFLRKHKVEREDREPSEAQLRTLEMLRELKGSKPPADCFACEKAWEAFVLSQLTHDDLDRAADAVDRLSLDRTDLRSLGGIVYALLMARRLDEEEHAVVVERGVQMILGGMETFDIADNLNVSAEEVDRWSDACQRLLQHSGSYNADARDSIAYEFGVPKSLLRKWYNIMQMLMAGADCTEVSQATGYAPEELAPWQRAITHYLAVAAV